MRLFIELFWVKIRSWKGNPMFVNCIRTFGSVVGRKKDDYAIWELNGGNIKIYKLISMYFVQWLIWLMKLPLMDLLMKYLKCGVDRIKNSENWATQVQVMSSWTLMYLFWPLTFINYLKMYWICGLGQSSVSNVILKMVTPFLALNLYRQPISSV